MRYWIRTASALSLTAFVILSMTAASADDKVEAAAKVVGQASNEKLLAELQRRFEKKRQASKSPSDKVLKRGLVSPLESLDDATLVEALKVTVRTRTIYGSDDRKDWYEIKNNDVKPLARASVALVNASDTSLAAGQISLKARPLRQTMGLCAGERYGAQPAAAFCSGTLVRPDVVLTAGHCVREISDDQAISPVTEVRFVFGYRMEKSDYDPMKLRADQIFSGKEVLAGEKNESRDWALIRLEKPVPAEIATPVTDWDTGSVSKGQKVFVIGYPSGIPLKYAPGAEVRDIASPGYFVANLDSFGGNSGSGVFDQQTKRLVGVLVRGDADFVQDEGKNCNRVHVCPNTGCRGEDVTRLSVVSLPQ